MTIKRRKSDQPVTQVEFDSTMTAIKQTLDHVATKEDLERFATKEELAHVRQLQEKTLRVQEATLTVVQSIEGRFKEIGDHEERIERLEDAVFKPATRRSVAPAR